MQKRRLTLATLLLITSCLILPLAADEKPPVFVFGGKQLYVGMAKNQAVEYLSACCKLSPPAESEDDKRPGSSDAGHFIFSVGTGEQLMLGAIYFRADKVAHITRSLDGQIDTSNDDVVGFARAINRALSPTTGDGDTTVHVSVRHQRLGNADADILSLSFSNGRGIQFQIGTLDKPAAHTGKRDFVTLDETLDSPRPR
jgi:hypothetical protein